MTTNLTGMKKIISAALLGSLLVTGAVAYADTAASDALKDTQPPAGQHRMEKGAQEADMLGKLVTQGVITAEEKTAIEKAMETQREQMKAQREAQTGTEAGAKARPQEDGKPASHFDSLAEAGLISQTLADKVDTYLDTQREADFTEKVKPLVDAGTFADTAAVKTAMDAVREAMKTAMDAQRPADDEVKAAVHQERPDFSAMTEAEKTALKAEMEAKRTEMEQKHEAAVKEVYTALVAKGTLTQAQADALQALKMGPEGGHGPGHGGPGMPPAASGAATAEK